MATANHATGELITIPARGGKAISIRQGQAVKVINTHGSQVVDTWAFNAQTLLNLCQWMPRGQPSVKLEQHLKTVTIPIGDGLFCISRKTPLPTFTIR